MHVKASVSDNIFHWSYKAGGDQWKQSVPLYKMVPCPMISIDRGTRWKCIAIAATAPVATGAVAWWLDLGPIFAIGAAAVTLLILVFRFAPWLSGPIEWAVFDTLLKDKTVYIFRGKNDDEFDSFVTAVDDAIEASICSSGNKNGEPSVATEAAS